MKKFALIFFMSVSTLSIIAQRPTNPPTPGTTTPPGIQGNPPGTTPPAGPKTGPRPYKEIITDKAITQKGLFTVHQVDDKFYFEIPDNILRREIMAVTRFASVPANSGATYGGEITNEQTIAFERGPNKNVFIRVITLINAADSGSAITVAVDNSNLSTIAAAFPIAAYGRDSMSVVIDITDYFKGDNQVVSIDPRQKRSFNLSTIAADRSYISRITSFPTNTEIRTVKTFNSTPATGGGAPSPVPSSSVPAASAAGAVTFELNTSMMMLPQSPMAIRYADRRVGYFTERYTSFSDAQQRVEEKSFAVRWRLEPKDGDVEKWKRGELVEPKKPIIYYIDPATPAQWRPYLIKGINDWQIAFEAAGFKNAIMGKEWPANEPTMSMEDSRYSVIRYFASNVENAYGPNVHDPKTGEILESHIGWYHNVMSLVHDWYMIQASAVDPGARKMKFEDSLMGQLIRFVSSHEVGHTLGLRHNMGSSSQTPVEKLRDKAWVEANGHTASIMDYARFNYVAQPGDNINSIGLFPRIGEYDKWAIKWGYGYIPGTNEEEQKKAGNKMIVDALAKNPRHYFGTYESGNRNDPRNQSEDLSDNAVKASEYGIKNLKYIANHLSDWTKSETDLNLDLTRMYGQLVGQYRRYMGHVASNVGGVYETFKTSAQAESVYEITPKSMQRESISFFHNQLFETPTWLINKSLLNRINNPGTSDVVLSAQEGTLGSLVNADRLNRLQGSVERFGADKAYSALDMLNDVQNGIYSELRTKKPTDTYRRSLQKSYVEKLNNILNPPAANAAAAAFGFGGGGTANVSRSDAPSIARAQLMTLKAQIALALPTITDRMTKIHLMDLQENIKDALDPKS
jgi:hypothetical protein